MGHGWRSARAGGAPWLLVGGAPEQAYAACESIATTTSSSRAARQDINQSTHDMLGEHRLRFALHGELVGGWFRLFDGLG